MHSEDHTAREAHYTEQEREQNRMSHEAWHHQYTFLFVWLAREVGG